MLSDEICSVGDLGRIYLKGIWRIESIHCENYITTYVISRVYNSRFKPYKNYWQKQVWPKAFHKLDIDKEKIKAFKRYEEAYDAYCTVCNFEQKQ